MSGTRAPGQPHAPATTARPGADVSEAALMGKLRRRLLPFLFLLYIVAYLDRINIGFAALQMRAAIGLSEKAFGLAAGLFFIGYFIFEVPSNLVLERVGARTWLARIIISWGVIAMAMATVRGARSLYLLRMLLGIAEAGFFPGIILYLTYWFPAHHRARAMALFGAAIPLAIAAGGPISGALLTMQGWLGMAGWRWLFVMEGLPAVLLGLVALRILPDNPHQAAWLSQPERNWLTNHLRSQRFVPSAARHPWLGALKTLNMLKLCVLYYSIAQANVSLTIWSPQIIKASGPLTDFQVGLLSALPYLLAACMMVLAGRSSDRTGERRWHAAGCCFIAVVGLICLTRAATPPTVILSLALVQAGISGAFGPFWSMPSMFMEEAAAAGGLAAVNSIGILGGFVGPYVIGVIRQDTHSFAGGLMVIAATLAIGGCSSLSVRLRVGARPPVAYGS
jgi:ACS family tartrate transporter-like MFS transporter